MRAAGLGIAILLLAAAGAIFVLTRGSEPDRARSGADLYRGSEPPGRIALPRFALRSYRGGVVASNTLRGKVVLVTFLDTACTEACPIIASQVGSGLSLLPRRERRAVTALALSVDPKVDRRARIHRFLRRRRALDLDFLTGPRDALRRAWRSFHILSAAETGDADIHSADVRIFDRRGVWVSTLHAGVDLSPANLAHDLRTALQRS